jgi:hypothetical protein
MFPALIKGEFRFEADSRFPPPVLPLAVAGSDTNHDATAADAARTGVMAGQWRLPEFPLPLERGRGPGRGGLTVIGTGEFAYTPFRIALALEEEGYDVRYQSTTRSPILVGDAMTRRWEFPDHQGDAIANYLYNLDPERLPLVIYEHPALQAAHSLAHDLGGLAFAVEEPCRVS